MKKLIPVICAIPAAWLTMAWAGPAADAHRGYGGAVGGEWLLSAIAFAVTYWIVSGILAKNKKSAGGTANSDGEKKK